MTEVLLIVIPESMGAACELGAFVNHSRLCQKLICIEDSSHVKDKSFINYGPIRMMRDKKKGRIVIVDSERIGESLKKIDNAVLYIRGADKNRKRKKVVNAVNSFQFVLASIFILEPVSISTICNLVSAAAGVDHSESKVIVAAGLAVLTKRGFIERIPSAFDYSNDSIDTVSNGYKLTESGINRFRREHTGDNMLPAKLAILDSLRIEVLSLKCRGRRMKCSALLN